MFVMRWLRLRSRGARFWPFRGPDLRMGQRCGGGFEVRCVHGMFRAGLFEPAGVEGWDWICFPVEVEVEEVGGDLFHFVEPFLVDG